jgi:hypothetical protein
MCLRIFESVAYIPDRHNEDIKEPLRTREVLGQPQPTSSLADGRNQKLRLPLANGLHLADLSGR